MEEEKTNIQQSRACPKDCRRCSMAQQLYCVTNLTFNSYEVMSKMIERLERIEGKVNTIQGAENGLLSPETRENIV